MAEWEVVKEKTKDHWLELQDGDYKASVKWDGCIHFSDEGEYIHICDLEDFIKRLEELRDLAKTHFGPKWPLG